jgi:hypothetical protein
MFGFSLSALSASMIRLTFRYCSVTAFINTGQYTHTGGETLKEIFTAHFPHSRLINDSDKEQKQLNLNICRSRTNRGDWNLATNVIDQKSDAHWVPLHHSSQPKQMRLYQQEMEHLYS